MTCAIFHLFAETDSAVLGYCKHGLLLAAVFDAISKAPAALGRLLQGLGATLSIGGLCILIAWYRSRLAESVAPVRATL